MRGFFVLLVVTAGTSEMTKIPLFCNTMQHDMQHEKKALPKESLF